MSDPGKEIVAFRFGTIITNCPIDIVSRLQSGASFEPLTRLRMQWMSAFDLGPRWTRLANSKTLFILDDEEVEL